MRIHKSKPDPTRNGEFLTAMNPKLNAYIRKHCPCTAVDGWENRGHLTHEELLTVHDEAGCVWWHRDNGIMVRQVGEE